MAASRGVFLVFRLPLLILLLLALLCGLGFGGWRLYSTRDPNPAAELQQRMQEKISGLASYHARFQTIPTGEERKTTYSVEIWKELPDRYRLEMITYESGRQSDLEVMIGNRGRVYLYDPEGGKFLLAGDLTAAELNGTFLEDYWSSISEAPYFNYLGEESAARHSYYQIEVVPSEPHRNRVSERVWLEKSTLLPVRIESLDIAGRVTQVTVFELLQLNPVFEAVLFQVESGISEDGSP